MKKSIRPIFLIASLSIFLGVLPLFESPIVSHGIPLYEIDADGVQQLIRVVPIDEYYVPSDEFPEVIKASKRKWAEKV